MAGILIATLLGVLLGALWWRGRRRGCLLGRPRSWGLALRDTDPPAPGACAFICKACPTFLCTMRTCIPRAFQLCVRSRTGAKNCTRSRRRPASLRLAAAPARASPRALPEDNTGRVQLVVLNPDETCTDIAVEDAGSTGRGACLSSGAGAAEGAGCACGGAQAPESCGGNDRK